MLYYVRNTVATVVVATASCYYCFIVQIDRANNRRRSSVNDQSWVLVSFTVSKRRVNHCYSEDLK